jgi:outer membrane lipopolysaccharide assembly protein LptE/RlpB
MDITINKIKNINEKNIQNQITKYEISITVNVKFYIAEKNLMNNFTITKSGVYSVNDRYSETVNNEKRLVKNMVNNINDQILKNLRTKLNDI